MSGPGMSGRGLPAVAGGLLAALIVVGGFVERLDLFAWDLASRVFRDAPPEDVVIVAVDEPSLRLFGRWPWPRRVHARILRTLDEAGVRAIGYDVVFAEPDPEDPEGDRMLAEALAAIDRVVVPVFPDQPVPDAPPIEILPMPALRGLARIGHVDVEFDTDGLVRRTFLRAGLGAPVWPSFAEAVLDAAAGKPTTLSPAQRPRSGWVRENPVLVPFLGPPGHFARISVADLLARPPAGVPSLAGAIVLVGATAPGLGDVLPTPVSVASHPMPGVEFNANLLEALRRGRAVRPLPAAVSAVVAGVATTLFLLLAFRRPGLAALAAPLSAAGGAVALAVVAQLWWPPAAVALVVPLVLGLRDLGRRVSERRRIRLEHARAHVTLHAIDEGVLTLDESDRIQQVNPAVVRIVGRPATELVGRRFDEAVRTCPLPGEHEPELREVLRPDGEVRIVEMRRRALPGESGRGGAVVTIADRTGELRARREVEAGRRRLRHLERELERETRRGALAQLAAAIAHEINQPLSAILNYANAGRRLARREGGELKSGVVESLEKLAAQAERAGEVVHRLRSLFEGGERQRELANPNRIVAEALELVRSESASGEIEAEYDLDLPDLPLDRIQIQQLVRNLVRNALEAGGGDDFRLVRVRTLREGDSFVLEVRDNGPGVPPVLRDRLFEPFATGRAEGLGVGLALCRQIAEAHGGRIEHGPAPEGGACFRVWLPIRNEAEERSEGAGDERHRSGVRGG